MRKKVLFLSILIAFCVRGMAETSSLSQIFLLGKGIEDLDKDNLGEKVSLHILEVDKEAEKRKEDKPSQAGTRSGTHLSPLL